MGLGNLSFSAENYIKSFNASKRTLNQAVMGPASPDLIRHVKTYDAFEEDIAIVNFYFEAQTVLKFSTTATQGHSLRFLFSNIYNVEMNQDCCVQ